MNGWHCNLCDGDFTMEEEDVFLHMRIEHDLDLEPETWPDGQLVVVDETLEPEDFMLGNQL